VIKEQRHAIWFIESSERAMPILKKILPDSLSLRLREHCAEEAAIASSIYLPSSVNLFQGPVSFEMAVSGFDDDPSKYRAQIDSLRARLQEGDVIQTARVLIADDQEYVRDALIMLLKSEGIHTASASSPAAVIEALRSDSFDLLMMDLNYARDTTSGQDGLGLITRIKTIDDTLPVVVMTAWGSIELAVEAIRRGARDFVLKPWDNSHIVSIIRSQVENGRALRKRRRLEEARKEIGQKINHSDDLAKMIRLVAERLRDSLDANSIAITIRSPRDLSSSLVAGIGVSNEALIELKREIDSLSSRARADQSPGSLTLTIRLNETPVGLIKLDGKKSGLDADELVFLSEVKDQVSAALGLIYSRQQQRDIEEARTIQQRLLPETIPRVGGCLIAAAWQPARAVSGDYFDVVKLTESRVALVIADVSGKGLPAAMLMSNAQAALRALASERITPSEMCEQINRVLCENIAENKFITFFYAVADLETRRLVYTNAGHNYPALARSDGSRLRLVEGGPPLGVFSDSIYEQGEVALASGDRLVLFTDGVVEATNPDDEEFGEERLIDLLAGNRSLDAERLKEKILKALFEFGGRSLHDDATLIVMSVGD
jgi:FixJ family two-component response regulator